MTATTKPVNVLTVLDEIDIVFDIGSNKEKRDSLRNVRAAIAELIELERQQREVLELLCETYIANRHSIGTWDFVKCLSVGGNRLADSETGRLWLRANNLAAIQGENVAGEHG